MTLWLHSDCILESSDSSQYFGVPAGNQLTTGSQCQAVAERGNVILGGVRGEAISRMREVVLPLSPALGSPVPDTVSGSGC